MATSSFYHNIVIDTDKKALQLTKALDASVEWSKAQPETHSTPEKATVVENAGALSKLVKALKI